MIVPCHSFRFHRLVCILILFFHDDFRHPIQPILPIRDQLCCTVHIPEAQSNDQLPEDFKSLAVLKSNGVAGKYPDQIGSVSRIMERAEWRIINLVVEYGLEVVLEDIWAGSRSSTL